MNKQEIEKAIDVLDGNKEGFENLLKDQPDHPMRGHIEHQIDCLKVAIQALEKQVPKRAEFAGGRYICRCGWDIYREEQCYCWSCGQKLDWSDK